MKTIKLGYLSIDGYTPKDPLFSDWMKEDPEYADEIKKNPESEVILPKNKAYTITIDYPLTNAFVTKLETGKNGLTRREVVTKICSFYKKIYDDEAKSMNGKESYIEGMYNRATSDGKYGIWGHVLGDLVLSDINIDGNKLSVGVDS